MKDQPSRSRWTPKPWLASHILRGQTWKGRQALRSKKGIEKQASNTFAGDRNRLRIEMGSVRKPQASGQHAGCRLESEAPNRSVHPPRAANCRRYLNCLGLSRRRLPRSFPIPDRFPRGRDHALGRERDEAAQTSASIAVRRVESVANAEAVVPVLRLDLDGRAARGRNGCLRRPT